MNIETPEELAEHLADWIGVYGCCNQHTEEGDKIELCTYDKDKPTCCRVAFTNDIVTRIYESVENKKKLDAAGIT